MAAIPVGVAIRRAGALLSPRGLAASRATVARYGMAPLIKKAGHVARPFSESAVLRCLDVACLLFAFVAGSHVEGHFLTFGEGFEAVHVDSGEVREEVFAAAV